MSSPSLVRPARLLSRLAIAATVIGVGIAAFSGLVTWALLQAPERFHALNPVTGAPIILHRGHGVRMPFDAAWSLEGLRTAPGMALLLVGGGALAVYAMLRWLDTDRARPWTLSTWLGFGLVGALVSWFFPVSYELNTRLGDGLTLPGNIGGGMTFGAEIATSELMVLATRFTASLGVHNALVAIRGVDTIAAFILVASVAALADGAASTSRGRALLFVGTLFSGASLQVMGYVETTVLELAAIAVYVAAAARILGVRRSGPAAPALAWAALGFAAMAHGAGALLLPSAAAMVAPRARLLGPRVQQHVTLFVVCVLLPFLVVVAPRWLSNDLGNADGGGDAIRFVPLDFDRVNPPSPVLYYGLFEALHFIDLGNALWVSAPIVLLVLLGLPLAGRAARPTPLVVLLAIAALFALVIPLAWNHDFGMWGDWNLASTYLFPLHVVSWVWLVQTLERFPLDRRVVAVSTALMALQLAGLAGLMLQLYAL